MSHTTGYIGLYLLGLLVCFLQTGTQFQIHSLFYMRGNRKPPQPNDQRQGNSIQRCEDQRSLTREWVVDPLHRLK